jgi:uncharacterized protein (DUF4415 family)
MKKKHNASYDFSNGKRGAIISHAGKTRITIWIDADILAAFRDKAQKECRGYQTAMNDALRAAAFQSNDATAIEQRIQERICAVVHEEIAQIA